MVLPKELAHADISDCGVKMKASAKEIKKLEKT
jgi:hypothetical protein